MFYLSPRALRMLKVERTMIRESNRISNRIPLCIIGGGAVFLWNEKLGLFKNGRVSKAIIQKFFLGILTNFEKGVEELWASKSFGYKKVQLGTKKPVFLLWFEKIKYCKWRTICFSSLMRQPLHLLGGKKWLFLFLTYCLSYTIKLYMIIIFPNSFIFDAILLRF